MALASACGLLLVSAAQTVSQVPAGTLAGPGSASTVPVIRTASEPMAPDAMPPATVLDNRSARGILGGAVRSATDEDMGRIVDVVVDRFGTTRAAVIDFGGFLGVGSRKIAVDWTAIRFDGLSRITLDMTRDQVKAAPQYETGKPVIVLGASPEFARSRVTERMPER
jgi:hypothetical protein